MGIKNRTKISLLTCLLITFAIFLFARDSYPRGGDLADAPGIMGTPHDLSEPTGGSGSGTNWIYQTTEVCVFCHTPHSQVNTIPLWNHTAPTTATYTMYTSLTFNMGAATPIGATSLLCMSCHDGTVAMNVVLNAPGRGNPNSGVIPLITAPATLGEVYFPGGSAGYPGPNISGSYGTTEVDDLRDEHPISFRYDETLDTDGNNFPARNAGGYIPGGITTTRYPLYGSDRDQFECSTCHDVHDTAIYTKQGTFPGEVFFLRVSNTNSQMCRDCHRNK